MAKPAFIYGFDNLGPYRFVELCAELLGARYKGFILGGVGPDGGIDAELDNVFGEWHPEENDALEGQIIDSGKTVVFQFKHKVTARTGQTNARTQLLKLFTGTSSEVSKDLVAKKKPNAYVLITNVEISSQFRDSFQDACKIANPDIQHYQVIGLDELENWVTQSTQLRHLYFPTIFDLPRHNLRLGITKGAYGSPLLEHSESLIQLMVYNIGTLPSYISVIQFKVIEDGQVKWLQKLDFEDHHIMKRINPQKGEPLAPGRSVTYHFRLRDLRVALEKVFLSEIHVVDEILNRYTIPVPENIRQEIYKD